jgi:tungstate transport system ATP-binding protein
LNKYLELTNIEKKYGDVISLDNISLEIEKSRVTTLVGTSGAGKTTLLRIINGLENATNGQVKFEGRTMTKKELRSITSMVFQKTVMFSTTVYANLAFGLKIRGFERKEIDEKIHTILSRVGMEEFAKRKAKKLSGGEQQRISLARALILQPRILILDEPTANLDPTNAQIIEDIINVTKNSNTIILATHNLFQAKRLSDKIAHIFNGKIIELSDSNKFFTNPTDERTTKFINGELQF